MRKKKGKKGWITSVSNTVTCKAHFICDDMPISLQVHGRCWRLKLQKGPLFCESSTAKTQDIENMASSLLFHATSNHNSSSQERKDISMQVQHATSQL